MTRLLARLVAVAVVLVAAWPGDAAAQRGPRWEVRVADRVEVVAGETGTLSISLAVDRGLVVSKDAPVIVDLAAAKGVTLRRNRLGRAEAVDPEADAPRFAVPVRADEPGEHALRVRLRFWLCGGKSCRPIDVRRTARIVVTPPAPPPDAGAGSGAAGP